MVESRRSRRATLTRKLPSSLEGRPMAKIVVAGGLLAEEGDAKNDARGKFARALGREIILRGHVILGGCRTELDAVVASAAEEICIEKNRDPKKLIRSWLVKSPLHMTKVRSPDRGWMTGAMCREDTTFLSLFAKPTLLSSWSPGRRARVPALGDWGPGIPVAGPGAGSPEKLSDGS
jgi:hypothetical protein